MLGTFIAVFIVVAIVLIALALNVAIIWSGLDAIVEKEFRKAALCGIGLVTLYSIAITVIIVIMSAANN